MRMDMRAVAYQVGGPKIGILPDILSCTVTIPRNSMPTISMTYPPGDIGVRGRLLGQEIEIGIECSYGNDWFELPGGRFLSQKNVESPLWEETGSKSFEAIHISRYMQEALVWDIPKSEKDSDGKWKFKAVNAGMMLKTLWDRAVSRGWGKGLTLNCNQHHDSNNAAWATVATLSFGKSISLYQVLETLENLGMVDYQWQGRTLNVYNADTYMSRTFNKTWPLSRGTTGAPESISWDALCTHLLVQGENGAAWHIKNDRAPTTLRRIEKVVEAGGVSLESTARLVARGHLEEASTAAEEVVREWKGDDLVLTPFRDYRIGDWLSVQRGYSQFDRLRVVQISITKDENGMSGHTTFGTRLDDVLSRLAKKTKGIVGGAAIAGNTVRPAPERGKARKPGVPTGVVARGDVVKNAQGYDVGVIQVSWAPVEQGADGVVQDVDSYEMRLRTAPVPPKNTPGHWRSVPAAELTQGFVDTLDPGVAYEVGVRALTEGVPGDWSNSVLVQVPKDAEPPPVPTPPTAKNVLGVVVVGWNGRGVRDQGMPSDFHMLEVGVAIPGGQLEVKSQATGVGVREQRVAGLAVGDWEIALRAVDRDGNASAWSGRTTVKVQSLVDADAIRRSLDEVLPDVKQGILTESQKMNRAMAALASRGILAGEIPPDEGEIGRTLWVGPDGKVFKLKKRGA